MFLISGEFRGAGNNGVQVLIMYVFQISDELSSFIRISYEIK